MAALPGRRAGPASGADDIVPARLVEKGTPPTEKRPDYFNVVHGIAARNPYFSCPGNCDMGLGQLGTTS